MFAEIGNLNLVIIRQDGSTNLPRNDKLESHEPGESRNPSVERSSRSADVLCQAPGVGSGCRLAVERFALPIS
ncbi:MAG: hypothetical protein ACRDPA_04435, partial [Solirubrobacteraceae bacterium]